MSCGNPNCQVCPKGVPIKDRPYEPGCPEFLPIIEGVLETLHDEEYWCKGNLYTHRNGHVAWCLIGASQHTMKQLGLWDEYAISNPEAERFRTFLEQRSYDDHRCSVAGFNDAGRTTYEDVILWVKKLIDYCR